MASPEISVVLPVRNAGRFLAAAIQSLLAQTHSDFEILLVDDHSDDGAIEALDTGDSRIRLLRAERCGVVAAFSRGMQAARGEFVARMDADDVCLPERLDSQLVHAKSHPELGIVGGCVEVFGDRTLRGGNQRYQTWLNSLCDSESIRAQMFVECPIPNPTAFFRRSVLARLGGYRDVEWPEDYDLFLRADRMGIKMGKPRETLLRWREHPGRVTHCDERYALHQFQRAKVHHLVHGRLGGRSVVLMGAGPTGCALHDLLVQAGAHVVAFMDVHPRRVGGLKRGLPVWPYQRLADDDLPFLLGAVGSKGAREIMREQLSRYGHREAQDYLFLA